MRGREGGVCVSLFAIHRRRRIKNRQQNVLVPIPIHFCSCLEDDLCVDVGTCGCRYATPCACLRVYAYLRVSAQCRCVDGWG